MQAAKVRIENILLPELIKNTLYLNDTSGIAPHFARFAQKTGLDYLYTFAVIISYLSLPTLRRSAWRCLPATVQVSRRHQGRRQAKLRDPTRCCSTQATYALRIYSVQHKTR